MYITPRFSADITLQDVPLSLPLFDARRRQRLGQSLFGRLREGYNLIEGYTPDLSITAYVPNQRGHA